MSLEQATATAGSLNEAEAVGLLVEDQRVKAVAGGEAGCGVEPGCRGVGFGHGEGERRVAMLRYARHAHVQQQPTEAATPIGRGDAQLGDVGNLRSDARAEDDGDQGAGLAVA